MEQERLRVNDGTIADNSSLLKENYKPSKQESLSRWEINITFMSRGCVIRVGCKTIPFSSTEEALAELHKYFNNPYETQEEWARIL